ncbi:unnamed protein product [Caenorhabditis angaria]|uniref:Uncharacterized protein n=1 Tax=Caenorhabditis angaria TaxID=860376 RepID=A0A9P1IRG1_9PELO|nr:unnamed protein product [Caenorhabditis angaria]
MKPMKNDIYTISTRWISKNWWNAPICKEFLVSHRLLGQMSEMEDAPSLSKSQIRLGSRMSTKINKIQRPNHQRSPGF